MIGRPLREKIVYEKRQERTRFTADLARQVGHDVHDRGD